MDEIVVEQWQDPEAPGKRGLKLAGRMIVSQAAGVRQALLEALGAASELRLDVASVEEIDLAGLQLICAAHKSARAADKVVTVHDGGNSAYLETAIEAGFRRDGCAAGEGGRCILFEGER